VQGTSAKGATVTIVSGQASYNPTSSTAFETLANGTSTTDTFSYTVTDNHGVTASQTATVTVSITDTGPTLSADTASTNEDGVITIDVPASTVTEAGPLDGLLYSVTTASMTLSGNAETPPDTFGSGIGGNPFNLVDVAPAYDFEPTQPTPSFFTCHPADGDGNINGRNGGSAHFHFDRDACEGDGATESVDEQDPGSGTNFHSTSITAATFDDITHTITIVGDGTNAGHPVTFTMLGVDNGALPGVFSLALSDGYAVSGTLVSGFIQLR